jgi:hypothetical protein
MAAEKAVHSGSNNNGTGPPCIKMLRESFGWLFLL